MQQLQLLPLQHWLQQQGRRRCNTLIRCNSISAYIYYDICNICSGGCDGSCEEGYSCCSKDESGRDDGSSSISCSICCCCIRGCSSSVNNEGSDCCYVCDYYFNYSSCIKHYCHCCCSRQLPTWHCSKARSTTMG